MRRLNLAKYTEEELPVVPQISDDVPSISVSKRVRMFVLQIIGVIICATVLYAILFYSPNTAEELGNFLLRIAALIRENMAVVYVVTVCGGVLFYLLRKTNILPPTHLAISSDGFRLYRSGTAVGAGSILNIYWADIRKVELLAQNKTRSEDIIRIKLASGKTHDLRAGYFGELKTWESFFDMLRAKAGNAEIDAEVHRLLEAPPDNNYTELWLSALSAPPARERMAPLAPKTALKDGLYFIREQLGAGGQGTAYVAVKLDRTMASTKQDPARPETVVLKEYVLPVHVMRSARKAALETLQNEAKLLQSLNHPNVVKMFDFFAEDHRGYLVFEHIRGKNLSQVVADQGPMPELEVRKLALQMCDILEYLHGQSPPVVHRDFTPDNLILDESGNLKLIDFNVAHHADEASGHVVGKPAYMPPEQFRGEPLPQSDIYAMGATLYFLLTAKQPEPLTVLQLNLDNKELSDFVRRCTAQNIDERFANVSDAKAILEPEQSLIVANDAERIAIPRDSHS